MKNNEKFEISVSIGDAAKAELELRTYGLRPKTAQEIIIAETITAVEDFGVIPQEALAPKLIEIFGEQHIIEAIKYSYLFMDEYNMQFDEYFNYLQVWLKNHRPEEFIVDVSDFKEFLNEIFNLEILEKIDHMNDDEEYYENDDLDEDEEDLEDNIDEN